MAFIGKGAILQIQQTVKQSATSSSTGAGSSTLFSTEATLSPPAQDCKTSSTLLPDASALASADRCTNDSGAFNISATLLKSSLI